MRPTTSFRSITTPREDPMPKIGRAAAALAVTLILVACTSGSPSVAPSSPTAAPSVAASIAATPSPVASAAATAKPATPAPSTAASPAAGPTIFTSPIYRYSLTVPAGWTVIPATAAWDGTGAPFHDVPEADQFIAPGGESAWFFGAPTTKDLAGRVKESIAANAAAHGNTCPAVPEINDPIKIGSEPGRLLGYNCGILINNGLSVHKGVAYLFGFRDTSVHAATDPADRAAFLALLASVQYPK